MSHTKQTILIFFIMYLSPLTSSYPDENSDVRARGRRADVVRL